MIRTKEAQVLKSIKLSLALYVPQVIWVDRLQSGTVRSGSSWIHMCKPGTPDLIAFMNFKGGITLLIECKGPKGIQSLEQKMFQHKFIGMKNIHYILARSVKDVVDYVNTNIKND